MNEQLQAKLVEILAAIQAGAKATGDFAMAQLPDIAQSYVMWGRAITSFYIFMGLVFLFVIYKVLVKLFKKTYDVEEKTTLCVVALMFSIAPMIMVFANISDCLMVWFAPKVWLVREVAHLIK